MSSIVQATSATQSQKSETRGKVVSIDKTIRIMERHDAGHADVLTTVRQLLKESEYSLDLFMMQDKGQEEVLGTNVASCYYIALHCNSDAAEDVAQLIDQRLEKLGVRVRKDTDYVGRIIKLVFHDKTTNRHNEYVTAIKYGIRMEWCFGEFKQQMARQGVASLAKLERQCRPKEGCKENPSNASAYKAWLDNKNGCAKLKMSASRIKEFKQGDYCLAVVRVVDSNTVVYVATLPDRNKDRDRIFASKGAEMAKKKREQNCATK